MRSVWASRALIGDFTNADAGGFGEAGAQAYQAGIERGMGEAAEAGSNVMAIRGKRDYFGR